MKKIFSLIAISLLSLALVSPAGAWLVPQQSHAKLTLTPAAEGETDFLLMPTTNIGFDISDAKNFGLGLGYSFILGKVTPADATRRRPTTPRSPPNWRA